MCSINDVTKCEKLVKVVLINDDVLESEWFDDAERVSVEDKVNCSENELANYQKVLEKHHISEDLVIRWYVCRKKENNDVYISEHAMQRAKERLGWNRSTTMRMMEKVVAEGKTPEEADAYLRPWLKIRKARMDKNEKMVIYGQALFIFQGNMFVTVLNLPCKSKIQNMLKNKCFDMEKVY